MSMRDVKKYVRERDEMLKKRSITALREFVKTHAEFYTPEFVAAFAVARDEVVEITLHKMIVNAIKLPKEMRDKSALWLIARGYSLAIN